MISSHIRWPGYWQYARRDSLLYVSSHLNAPFGIGHWMALLVGCSIHPWLEWQQIQWQCHLSIYWPCVRIICPKIQLQRHWEVYPCHGAQYSQDVDWRISESYMSWNTSQGLIWQLLCSGMILCSINRRETLILVQTALDYVEPNQRMAISELYCPD